MDQLVATDDASLKKGFLPAPENPADWPRWRSELRAWADSRRAELGPVRYDPAAQAWASRCYAQGFVMLWDHELIDHHDGSWKVDRLLDRAERDFGGYDLVVLWNNYPLSGVDARHQLAYFDLLPGGRAGLREAVERFHARGVRVLVDHKPWVPGLPEGCASVEDAFVDLVAECGLDGIYLDCSDGPADAFREALATRAGPERIFISEAPARLEPFGHEIGSWQQFTDDSAVPGTYRNRWLDRRHLVYESRRYFHDPMRELQRAWMNGGGFVVWENVFGYWAAYSARSKSWMRLLFPALRHFSDWFIEGEWEPHLGGGSAPGVTVSRWTLAGVPLHTVANRRGHALDKTIATIPGEPGHRWVDVISGRELEVLEAKEGTVRLGGRLERDGCAGLLPLPEGPADPALEAFLQAQRERCARGDWAPPAWEGEHRRTELPHILRQVSPTPRVAQVPPGMLPVPDFEGWMTTRYRMRECGYIAGVVDEKHVYDAFEKTCPCSRPVRIRRVALDVYPVTNDDFAAFLGATGYQPRDPRQFLAHWTEGRPPAGLGRHPVVYVSLGDARAYARWAGKRLPREEEWQQAALGPGGAPWPWGEDFDPARCRHGASGTAPVDAHPAGISAAGFHDCSGNVWEMTESERTDDHTRYQILKGGCWHHVEGSHWLFDTGARPADWGAKHILLCDAWDRCATVGFRCAVDL
ncbi:MAG: hypothetical protein EA425_05350 [Puniceicoccaceae bacterium]|nr:MAG: hypothetical protein EA425_05350 [Puniceicoccaceae bacterium]